MRTMSAWGGLRCIGSSGLSFVSRVRNDITCLAHPSDCVHAAHLAVPTDHESQAVLHQPDEQQTPKNDDEDRRGLLNQEICRVTPSSIDPAADIDAPSCIVRVSDDHSAAACANAASPVHTARAD